MFQYGPFEEETVAFASRLYDSFSPQLAHNYVNMHMSNNNVNNSGHPHHYHLQLQHQKLLGTSGGCLGQQQQQQQHRLSGQSYESGVSSRQSYHSSGSSSVGSLDLLEEQGGYSSSTTINVGQLVQAGVAVSGLCSVHSSCKQDMFGFFLLLLKK